MPQSGVGGYRMLLAMADTPVVLAPCHFVGVGGQVRTDDVVMDADFSATGKNDSA
jgi:hypothetical protein